MYKVNIVVPSITTDSRLVRCLNGVQNLNYKNFKKIKFKDYYYNYKEYMNLIDVKDLLSM